MTNTTEQQHPAVRAERLTADITSTTPPPKPVTGFDALPDGAYVRLAQLVRDPKKPEASTPLPFSAATAWRKILAGTFPKPIKLSERVTAFKVGEIRQWLAARSGE